MDEKKYTQKVEEEREEYLLRKMLQATGVKAPEGLKYRIMQQVETEKALAPLQKANGREGSGGDILRAFGSIFGTMYAVLTVMIAAACLRFGGEYLLSPRFTGAALSVVSAFSLLWLVTCVDSLLRGKYKK
ncbi:MAG: hypothetical protein LBH72_04120 [Proteiniphilum sp.]|jgi:hypothetical protein|nr:hypothetical protein [Proteiniphilum sp.]